VGVYVFVIVFLIKLSVDVWVEYIVEVNDTVSDLERIVDLVKVYVVSWVLLMRGDPDIEFVPSIVILRRGVKEDVVVPECVFVACIVRVGVTDTVDVFEIIELNVVVGLWEEDLDISGLHEYDRLDVSIIDQDWDKEGCGLLVKVPELVCEIVYRGLTDLDIEGDDVLDRLIDLRGVNEDVAVSEDVQVNCIDPVIVYESYKTVEDGLGCLEEVAETVDVLLDLWEDVYVVVPEFVLDTIELAVIVFESFNEVVKVVDAVWVFVGAIDLLDEEDPVLVLEDVDVEVSVCE